MSDTVSVVIPNFNNGQFLKECVDSVFRQTYPCLECIIVDDGSTDNSIQIISVLQKKYNNLEVIFQKNGGPSKARNNGWIHAKGSWIAFLDADDVWKPEKIKNQLEKALKEEVDLVASQYVWFNEKGISENPHLLAFPKSPFDFWSDTFLSPSTVLVKKEVLERLGGWDNSLWTCEDMDLWFRVAASGHSISINESKDVFIRQHSNNSKGNLGKMILYHEQSLEKWLGVSRKYNLGKKEPIKFKEAIHKKLRKIRYYAATQENKKIALKTFFIGYNALGFGYFMDKLTIIQLLYWLKKK